MIEQMFNFKKLKPKEKLLLAGLLIVIGFSFYFNVVYKPLSVKITRYRSQIEKSMSRIESLRSEFPQIEKYEQNIHALDGESNALVDKIAEIEKKIPSRDNTSQLMSELIQESKGINMVSVRQKLEPGEEYARIFIELKFNSPYKDTIQYINRLESISPFLVIEELDISEPKAGREKGGTPTRLVLSTLLGHRPTAEKIKREAGKDIIEVPRDIFISKARPVSEDKKDKLEIKGITYNPKNPTAIVNDEVVRIGSKLDNFTVKEIRSDSVILTDGVEDHILSVER